MLRQTLSNLTVMELVFFFFNFQSGKIKRKVLTKLIPFINSKSYPHCQQNTPKHQKLIIHHYQQIFMYPLVHTTSLDTRPTEGPIKSLFSVCLSVRQFSNFVRNRSLDFSDFRHDGRNWNV